MQKAVEIKIFKNTEIWKDAVATCFKFQLENIQYIRETINTLNQTCTFEKIISEKSLETDRKRAQKLIESGELSWFLDPKNGTPCEEIQEEIGWYGSEGKWSKWTVEKILQEWGWKEGEVYWFTLSKDRVYNYPLILRNNDWICYCPAIADRFNTFVNVGQSCRLPYFSSWKLISS